MMEYVESLEYVEAPDSVDALDTVDERPNEHHAKSAKKKQQAHQESNLGTKPSNLTALAI
jgi:hypothetical protein